MIEKDIEQYLQICELQRSLDRKTIKAYHIDLKQFDEFLNTGCESISKEVLSRYIVNLNQQFKPRSVKRKLASLKAFFRYLEEEGVLVNNPFRKMRIRIQEPRILPRTVPLHTIEGMLRCAYAQIEHGESRQRMTALRDTAVMELLFATGVRVSELCSLNTADIDLLDGKIMIWGKGSKERLLQIGNPDVLSILMLYSAARRGTGDGPFFLNRRGTRLSEQSVRLILKKYTEQAAVTQHITPHMFRHSFATLLLEEGVDIRYIQQMLGHSSIITTQIYTTVTTAKQKSILETKHPRNHITI